MKNHDFHNRNYYYILENKVFPKYFTESFRVRVSDSIKTKKNNLLYLQNIKTKHIPKTRHNFSLR